MTTLPGGTLVVSIDLPEIDHRQAPRDVPPAALDLARMLDAMRIPATWAFAHPGRSPLALRLATSPVGHEIALLGGDSWIGPHAGRTRFVHELSCRLQLAREVGLGICTLSLSATQLRHNLDVLVKYRLAIVRAPLDRGEAGFVEPHALRYGVWEARPTVCLPAARPWWTATNLLARWTLGKAASTGSIVHLAIDVGRLDPTDAAGLKPIHRVLLYAARMRDEGLLVPRTLSHLRHRFQRRRQSAPMRSILRPAA
jgi:hypothetical protein